VLLLVLGLGYVEICLKQASVCCSGCGMLLDFGCSPLLRLLAGGQSDLLQSLRSAAGTSRALRGVWDSPALELVKGKKP